MKSKSLSDTNPFLKDRESARRRVIRSIANSTGVETGESIQEIEKKLKQNPSAYQVKLA